MEAGGEIFHNLFDEFNFWAVIVFVIVIVWQFHHSLKYRSKDGKSLGYDSDEFTPGVFPKENDMLPASPVSILPEDFAPEVKDIVPPVIGPEDLMPPDEAS